MVFANAGVSEEMDYFEDTFDESGQLQEPRYAVVEVNLRAVLNVIKLSLRAMRKQTTGGSIVLTASATAYVPEQSLPVYSALKLALVGLVRSLRATVIRDNITINAVAPAATITKLLPADFAQPILAAGLPVSSAHSVGLALVYSAVAKEQRQVEAYGKDKDEEIFREGRWNGRCIMTMGDRFTELEEPIANAREIWYGKENLGLTRLQQMTTDLREAVAFNRS
ncbi:Short-chain dehydrogenase/reductase prx4 [Trapelia coarctata]|nr:Short-chain dehydrogenase/reductase prx4 [Trapelia coarctata]